MGLRILFVALLTLVFIALSGCSGVLPSVAGMAAESFLGGSGPGVDVSAQVGRTNTRTIGTSAVTETRLQGNTAETIRQTTSTTKVQTERAETVVVNEAPFWLVLLALLGWFLPTPRTIFSELYALVRRKARRASPVPT